LELKNRSTDSNENITKAAFVRFVFLWRLISHQMPNGLNWLFIVECKYLDVVFCLTPSTLFRVKVVNWRAFDVVMIAVFVVNDETVSHLILALGLKSHRQLIVSKV